MECVICGNKSSSILEFKNTRICTDCYNNLDQNEKRKHLEYLKPINSLVFFQNNIPDFLKDDAEIIKLCTELIQCLKEENPAYFHADILRSGKQLIKYILQRCIEYLSKESNSPYDRSIKKIRDYIDAFTVFEEMLFGLDTSYRDHTLHSLWVYLFGHQWIVKMGGYEEIKIAGQIDVYFHKNGKLKFIITTDPINASKSHLEAMWGIIATIHDFGYPVEAISNKPNKIFDSILEPFAIDFSSLFQVDLGSRITLLHDSLCDLLSTVYRPKGLSEEEENRYYEKADSKSDGEPLRVWRAPAVSKAESQEMEFRIASVDKVHSAWSTIFAFKNITYLHESDHRGGGGRDYLKLLTRRDILYSIVHHTSEGPKDRAVNRFQFILLLMDDIEEVARYGKGGRERGVKSDYCDMSWYIDSDKTILELDYRGYDSEAEHKFEELLKKYKSQTLSEIYDKKHEIEIRFIGDNFDKTYKLSLMKD